MANVNVENDKMTITMQGARKFFALKSEVSIFLGNVVGVKKDFDWENAPKIGEKRMGTDAYGFYFGGHFSQDGNKVFYDLKKKENAVVITVKDEVFDTLIIGVENSDETVALIEQALKTQGNDA